MKRLRYIFLSVLFIYMMFLWFVYICPVEFLGNSIRILFFHVPLAWISVLSFMLSLFFSVRYIMKKDRHSAYLANLASIAGFWLLVAAAVSGALWAGAVWNSYWNWDVRQTSLAVLILIYSAYFSVRMSVRGKNSRDMISSVYLLFASVTVPIFIFIVPRLYESLHPNLFSEGKGFVILEEKVMRVLVFSVFYFTWTFAEIFFVLARRSGN